jgi:hypothetical protein
MSRRLACVATVVAALVLSCHAVRAESPYDGTWKVVVLLPNSELSLYILHVDSAGSQPKIELRSASNPAYAGTPAVESAAADALRFSVKAPATTFKFSAYPPRGEKAPATMPGSVLLGSRRDLVRFERTDLKELDAKQAARQFPEYQDYLKAMRTKEPEDKAEILKELAGKTLSAGLALQVQLELAAALAAAGAKDDAIKNAADRALELTATYGPEMRNTTLGQVAQKLIAAKKAANVALIYARLADKELPASSAAAQKVAVLQSLASALKQADRPDEVKSVEVRLAKLEKVLDEEFLKSAVPFETTRYQRSAAGRVALVELFTGAQCPPCVAADVAFDAALKTYGAQDVILLQYHLHIPGPDALTNDDTEKRARYYKVQGVPATYVGGGKNLPLGGSKQMAKASYERLTKALTAQLDKEAPATIQATARQTGDDIAIVVEVANLKDAGDDTKLRVVLVEENIRYPGRNGQRFHHHVVRAMPGGPEGFELKSPSQRQEVKINLAELKRTLGEYLDKSNERRPFIDDQRPLDLSHLLVVAFIQNDQTQEVLQATQASVQR